MYHYVCVYLEERVLCVLENRPRELCLDSHICTHTTLFVYVQNQHYWHLLWGILGALGIYQMQFTLWSNSHFLPSQTRRLDLALNI